MELTTLWFLLIAFLWVCYLVLEGFDFGVGMLTTVLARDEKERRVLLNTIGPVWDGNEVWLVVAVGATFAAFPEWYASMLSGFYLPLFVVLVALILRIVALDYRSKRPSREWRRRCDLGILVGSVVPAFLWGVLLANLVGGVPIDADREVVGGLGDLFGPYALLGGAVTLGLSLVHGAVFVGLKTVGDVRGRARALALRAGLPVLALTALFVGWTAARDGDRAVWVAAGVTVAALAAGLAAARRGREGWAFLGTAMAVGGVVGVLFGSLFPVVMTSTLDPAWSLTTSSAASSPYTLGVLSWVALLFTPVVLGYQGWTYWVFRRRLGTHHIPDEVLAPHE